MMSSSEVCLPWLSCWQPVNMGADTDNDAGAISTKLLDTAAMNEAPNI